MKFMNEYDLEEAVDRFSNDVTPNRGRVAQTVYALMQWTNQNSDGWPYWSKPVQAARKALELIDPITWEDVQRMEGEDCTVAELTAALTPIKAFLTRQGVEHRTIVRAA